MLLLQVNLHCPPYRFAGNLLLNPSVKECLKIGQFSVIGKSSRQKCSGALFPNTVYMYISLQCLDGPSVGVTVYIETGSLVSQ